MGKYCAELEEFHEIIHDKEKLKNALFLNAGFQHGRPAMTFCSSFFLKYSNHPMYLSVIEQVLEMTYQRWNNYCVQHNVVVKEELEDAYANIMSIVFKENGIK